MSVKIHEETEKVRKLKRKREEEKSQRFHGAPCEHNLLVIRAIQLFSHFCALKRTTAQHVKSLTLLDENI